MNENNSYIKGILGGIIGGLIATIPWILMYVYGNMIVQILSVVVAIGVLKGYQMFHGKVNEKLPIFIAIISILSITIATVLIIPILLLIKENIPVSMKMLQYLFSREEFISALTKDYAISLLFTILGISGVIRSVKKQIDDGETENIKAGFENRAIANNNQENIEIFQDAFTKLNALDKEHAISKEEIIDEIENPDAERLFKNLRTQQIIAKYKGKYYFKEKYAKSTLKRFLKLFFMIYGFLILFVLLLLIIVL